VDPHLIEVTLAVVLFVDASSVAVHWFQRSGGIPCGCWASASAHVPSPARWWPSSCSPDSTLGRGGDRCGADRCGARAGHHRERAIPLTFRKLISVESGLNGNLATPSWRSASQPRRGSTARHPVTTALTEIAIGVVVGSPRAASAQLTRAAVAAQAPVLALSCLWP
jgi:hypothetical protein